VPGRGELGGGSSLRSAVTCAASAYSSGLGDEQERRASSWRAWSFFPLRGPVGKPSRRHEAHARGRLDGAT